MKTILAWAVAKQVNLVLYSLLSGLLFLLGSLGYVTEQIIEEIKSQPATQEGDEPKPETVFSTSSLPSTICWARQLTSRCYNDKDNPRAYGKDLAACNEAFSGLQRQCPKVRWCIPIRYITKTHVVLEYEFTVQGFVTPTSYRLSAYRWPCLCLFGNRRMERKSFDRLVLPIGEAINENLAKQVKQGDQLDVMGTLTGVEIRNWSPSMETPYLVAYLDNVKIDPHVSNPLHRGKPRSDNRGAGGEITLREQLIRSGLGQN